MVTMVAEQTDTKSRWLCYLFLSVVLNLGLIRVVDFSVKSPVLEIAKPFQITFSSRARTIDAVSSLSVPRSDAKKTKVPVPAPVPAPVPVDPETTRPPSGAKAVQTKPVLDVVMQKAAQKTISINKKPGVIKEASLPARKETRSFPEPTDPGVRPFKNASVHAVPMPRRRPTLIETSQAIQTEPVEKTVPEQTVNKQKFAPVKTAALVEKLAGLAPSKIGHTRQEAKAGDQGDADASIIGTANYRRKTPLRYPKRALDLGQQGTVKLHVRITPDGTPTELKVARSSGYRLLDKAALAAVQKWEFVPRKQGATTVASWVSVPVDFVIR
ncbi:energy transducer TonB [Sneathiella aquimaris]|uniref:energy transducer TonB n=1 Tax=Sneathiella aquimaris TaxID=2599305 RepID=UPI00146DD9E8|nr:energy transducer TonB [Sneathiella aquimaris]